MNFTEAYGVSCFTVAMMIASGSDISLKQLIPLLLGIAGVIYLNIYYQKKLRAALKEKASHQDETSDT